MNQTLRLLLELGTLRPTFATGRGLSAAGRTTFSASAGRGTAGSTLRTAFAATAWGGSERARLATLTAGTALSGWALRAKLFFGNFAVAIFVELLEGLCGFGEFFGVDGSVFVDVERFDDRADGTESLSAGANITGRTISLWAISLWAISLRAISLRTISLRTISLWAISLWAISLRAISSRTISARWSRRRCVLGDDEVRRCADCQREDDAFCFHGVCWLLCFFRARFDAVNRPIGA